MTGRRRSDADRRWALLRLAAIAVAVIFIIAVVLSVVALALFVQLDHTVSRVKRNTDRVSIVAAEVARVEARDTVAIRDAAYRICEREQRDRAEQHFRAGLVPPAQAKAIIERFGLPPSAADVLSLKALRRRLPIFDCSPNLRGEKARVMTDREQISYVKRYISGQLAPVPAVPPDQSVLSNTTPAPPLSTPAPATPSPSGPSGIPPAADHTPAPAPRRSPPERRAPRPQPAPAPSRPAPSPAPAPAPSPQPQPAPLPVPKLPCVPIVHPC